MDVDSVTPGLRIKTIFNLGDTKAMSINQKHLDARKPDAEGTVLGAVVGHGCEVFWVRHDGDRTNAAYVFNEFDPV